MIEQLRKKIKDANKAYRLGRPLISDSKYDQLIEELSLLSPDDDLLSSVGISVADESRKVPLPIDMASMNKLKTIDDIKDWLRLKNIPLNENLVITPKLDGLSLCVDEISQFAVTRGDGKVGQRSNDHYKLINNHLDDIKIDSSKYESYVPSELFTYGEVMMSKDIFLKKYSKDFANPRNLVAGLLNNKEATTPLKDCDFIKYGLVTDDSPFETKSELLKFLNKNQSIKIKTHICRANELTEKLLIDLFHKWSTDYEIDGVIVEVDSIELQNRLGRETSSNNPCYARAFKHSSFEQSAITDVIGISWNISKQGLLKPILHINPVKLDGVTVSNVTGNNARFVKDMGLGVGATVVVKRSGMVIPLICDVIKSVDFVMPKIEGVDLDWNENGIELVTLSETDDQRLKKNISFFEILEADNVGEGVIKQLWDAGHKTIKDILGLKISDFEKIDRFGKRKATIVYNSIQKSVKGVSLSKLQHATGIFKGLGSKKLILLEHFKYLPSIEQVMEIEGFAETSAKAYIDGYGKFCDFIEDLPITFEEKLESVSIGSDLDGQSFVFTGVRRPDLEEVIESRGGKISSGVSKNTTYLVMKSIGSGSSKEKKAIEVGAKIITVEELENLLK
jgi:DNA ligase (NAD+)